VTLTPLVSVLFTTYNHAQYADEALNSIADQTLRSYEVIATDDCSQDESSQVVERWLGRNNVDASFAMMRRNSGICAVRNQALARPLVCSLSGDDRFNPQRLEIQSAFLLSQPPDVCAVYSDIDLCDESGRTLSSIEQPQETARPRRPQGWVFRALQRENFIPAPAILVRREALDAVGPYDQDLLFEDWDMWLRLAARFKFAYLPMHAATKRVLPTSLGHRSNTPDWGRSLVRLHGRWLGSEASQDEWAAFWIRRGALRMALADRKSAQAALVSVEHVPSTSTERIPWRFVRFLLALPFAESAFRAAFWGLRRFLSLIHI